MGDVIPFRRPARAQTPLRRSVRVPIAPATGVSLPLRFADRLHMIRPAAQVTTTTSSTTTTSPWKVVAFVLAGLLGYEVVRYYWHKESSRYRPY